MTIKQTLSREEVIQIVERNLGKTLGELNYNKVDTKGSIGQFIEEELFDYAPNSKSEKDFKDADLELKVTPYKMNKNGSFSSKERLVLNIINYMTEHKKDFSTSSFWQKNSELIILFYEHLYDQEKKSFPITHYTIYDYPPKDLKIICNDWQIIRDKILRGEAHLISEADTMYLAACTKGANRHSTRRQPFSSIPAKQRAYSFKSSFMTQLLRQVMFQPKKESLVDESLLEEKSFETIVLEKLAAFKGRSVKSLASEFGLNEKAKSINYMVLSRILGIEGNIKDTEEFQKANIVPKTIRLEEDGSIREHMSFPSFKFTELIKESWESSNLRELLETTKFMFVVFQKMGKDYRYVKSVFWNMPISDLEIHVFEVWQHTFETIDNGNIVKEITKSGIRKTNFIGSQRNLVAHVRPHAQNAKDVYPLPTPDKLTGLEFYTKQCFWLNRGYILNIIK